MVDETDTAQNGVTRNEPSLSLADVPKIIFALLVMGFAFACLGCWFLGTIDLIGGVVRPSRRHLLPDAYWAHIGYFIGLGIVAIYILYEEGLRFLYGAIILWPVSILLVLVGGFVGSGAGAIIGLAIASAIGRWVADDDIGML